MQNYHDILLQKQHAKQTLDALGNKAEFRLEVAPRRISAPREVQRPQCTLDTSVCFPCAFDIITQRVRSEQEASFPIQREPIGVNIGSVQQVPSSKWYRRRLQHDTDTSRAFELKSSERVVVEYIDDEVSEALQPPSPPRL